MLSGSCSICDQIQTTTCEQLSSFSLPLYLFTTISLLRQCPRDFHNHWISESIYILSMALPNFYPLCQDYQVLIMEQAEILGWQLQENIVGNTCHKIHILQEGSTSAPSLCCTLFYYLHLCHILLCKFYKAIEYSKQSRASHLSGNFSQN